MSVKEWVNRTGILSVPIINLFYILSDFSLLYFQEIFFFFFFTLEYFGNAGV